ncbi:hypothetical protein BGW42_007663 [Actinomortierella wolfii]|nr:hypothetical protein BGW42_007663 [Actinomortierella wolfii]
MALLPSTSRASIWHQRHRILLITLVFVVLVFLYGVHVDWVPYLNQTGILDVDSDMQRNHGQGSSSMSSSSSSSSSPSSQPSDQWDWGDDLGGTRQRNPFYSVLPQREPFEGEKFLAYFPHSGFHNQRITLENGLRLAAYLNRTLLLPPLYLSKFKEGLVWKPPPILEQQWIARNRSGVEYCRNNDPTNGKPALTKSQISHLPPDMKIQYNQCYFYHAWTVVPWTFFFDIPKVIANVVGVGGQTEPIRVFDRPNMTIPWLKEHLKIKDLEKEVYFFDDATRYHYKIIDDSATDYSVLPEEEQQYDGQGLAPNGVWKGRYAHPLLLSNLKLYPHRVLHFGSLYASDRVEAATEEHQELKKYIEDSMDLWNEDIEHATKVALKRIDEWRQLTGRKDPGFLGVHLRTADGPFIDSAGKSLQRLRVWVRTTVQLENNLPEPLAYTPSTPRSDAHEMDKRAPPASTKDTENKDKSKDKEKEKEKEPVEKVNEDDNDDEKEKDDMVKEDNDSVNDNDKTSTDKSKDVPTSTSSSPDTSTDAPVVPEPNAPKNHPAHAPAEQTEIPKTFLQRCMDAPEESPLVFMSTDVPQPRTSEMLREFIDEFPCTIFLSDLPESLQILDRLQNPIDGIRMLKYTVAMLDANIVARSRLFQGTQRSTFSKYIYLHLWPEYHDGQIMQEFELDEV